MKRLLSILFSVIIMASAFAGCSDGKPDSNSVDVDLTLLSSTMIYSEVYNMVSAPDEYLGKRVRIKGNFQRYEGLERVYYACVIPDATACCQQGLEFRLKKEIPDSEYPELDSEIEVIGTFSTYMEDDLQYVELIDCTMEETSEA